MIYDKTQDGKNQALIGRTWIQLQPQLTLFQTTDSKQFPILNKKPKWHNIIYDPTDQYQGKILIGYTLIRKEHATFIPMESMEPETSKTELNVFCIGLRDIDETIDDIKPKNVKVLYDFSGQQYEKIWTESQKIKCQGTNLNKLITITLNVPRNKNFSPVLDTFVYESSPGQEEQILGCGCIELDHILNYYKYKDLPKDAIIEESESDFSEGDLEDAYQKKDKMDLLKKTGKTFIEGEELNIQ